VDNNLLKSNGGSNSLDFHTLVEFTCYVFFQVQFSFSFSQFSSLPPVRVVFAVTMEGSARKVITVRSALIVKNRLETPMELRLDSPSAPDSKSGWCCYCDSLSRLHSVSCLCPLINESWGGDHLLQVLTLISVAEPVVLPAIMPGDSFAVPLHLTSWRLQARPKGMGVFFCKVPIHWTNVVKTAEVSSSKRECHSMDTEKSRFFRCVAAGMDAWVLTFPLQGLCRLIARPLCLFQTPNSPSLKS
jgi:hypothetical protein